MAGWWIFYARARHEFEVADQIAPLAMQAVVPRKVETHFLRSQGYIPKPSPILTNYVMVQCTPEQWHAIQAANIKHLSPTAQMVADRVAMAQLVPFIGAAAEEYADRMARIEAGEKVSRYKNGDTVELMAGRLAGMTATFRRMVEASWPPEVIVSVGQIGGKDMALTVEAQHIRTAGAA